MAKYLITGASGFIASKVCELLLAEDHEVIGIDNLNDAYDVRLKKWRLDRLQDRPHFTFHRLDICRKDDLHEVFSSNLDGVINLAARAGVRQSVENPDIICESQE